MMIFLLIKINKKIMKLLWIKTKKLKKIIRYKMIN